ncbi:LAMI_0C03224g1_1 [Lachancea mirantina]|uniref:LAMI_0C03224g1_1 n=1 Tax=Lachancea mirantina TaxID=1230905 RepID=A0A1G4J1D4_9SACH|nr:LAMI_0C03224g1_1 [Lachancea mirantina]
MPESLRDLKLWTTLKKSSKGKRDADKEKSPLRRSFSRNYHAIRSRKSSPPGNHLNDSAESQPAITHSEPASPLESPKPNFSTESSPAFETSPAMLDRGLTGIDYNKLERGEYSPAPKSPVQQDAVKPKSRESKLLPTLDLFPRGNTEGNPTIHSNGAMSAPPTCLIEHPPRDMNRSPLPSPRLPDCSQNPQDPQRQSQITNWLWALYYNNQIIFYCVFGLLLIASSIYTALTGKGSKYYVVIVRATICWIMGSNVSQNLLGDGFCSFGDI